jgi:hypothetical protein
MAGSRAALDALDCGVISAMLRNASDPAAYGDGILIPFR